jgi:hypothetical protein
MTQNDQNDKLSEQSNLKKEVSLKNIIRNIDQEEIEIISSAIV